MTFIWPKAHLVFLCMVLQFAIALQSVDKNTFQPARKTNLEGSFDHQMWYPRSASLDPVHLVRRGKSGSSSSRDDRGKGKAPTTSKSEIDTEVEDGLVALIASRAQFISTLTEEQRELLTQQNRQALAAKSLKKLTNAERRTLELEKVFNDRFDRWYEGVSQKDPEDIAEIVNRYSEEERRVLPIESIVKFEELKAHVNKLVRADQSSTGEKMATVHYRPPPRLTLLPAPTHRPYRMRMGPQMRPEKRSTKPTKEENVLKCLGKALDVGEKATKVCLTYAKTRVNSKTWKAAANLNAHGSISDPSHDVSTSDGAQTQVQILDRHDFTRGRDGRPEKRDLTSVRRGNTHVDQTERTHFQRRMAARRKPNFDLSKEVQKGRTLAQYEMRAGMLKDAYDANPQEERHSLSPTDAVKNLDEDLGISNEDLGRLPADVIERIEGLRQRMLRTSDDDLAARLGQQIRMICEENGKKLPNNWFKLDDPSASSSSRRTSTHLASTPCEEWEWPVHFKKLSRN